MVCDVCNRSEISLYIGLLVLLFSYFNQYAILYLYEAEFIQTFIKNGKRHLAKSFCFTYRYIDDVLSTNNPKFGNYIDDIYPAELEIKDTRDQSGAFSWP